MGKLLGALIIIGAMVGIATIGLVFFGRIGEEAGPASGAKLSLEGDIFDLGYVPADETVERGIPFGNTGTAPLEVTVVKVRPAPDAACGCGVEGYEVRPATVPAGGTGELVFKLRVPENMPDMEDIMIAELRTNDIANPNLKISLVFRMAGQENVRAGE